MKSYRKKTWQKGFTLVELLISMALISIAVVISLQAFFLVYEGASQSYQILQMEATARHALSLMGDRVHEGFIDYDFYTAAPNLEPEFLAVRNFDGEQSVFWIWENAVNDNDLYLCDGKGHDESCAKAVDPTSHPDWTKVNPNDVTLTFGIFNIYPDDTPYLGDTLIPASDVAPIVQIRLKMISGEGAVPSPVIQTAFTTRTYVR